jgi:hypothetical protein
MVRQVADWKLGGIACVSPASRNIYCPYDGGTDIFSFSVPPSALEASFARWMSTHPGKL